MIYASTIHGHADQVPDRFVSAVDAWAGKSGRGADVFAQIGHTDLRPRHIGWAPLDGPTFRALFDSADLIVAHAGMGTILAALEQLRPLIVVSRRADLGEHRNEQQLSTARALKTRNLTDVAIDEHELIDRLERIDVPDVSGRPSIGSVADPMLIQRLRRFLGQEAARRATPGRKRVVTPTQRADGE